MTFQAIFYSYILKAAWQEKSSNIKMKKIKTYECFLWIFSPATINPQKTGFYTEAYVRRLEARLRGYLSASMVPIQLKAFYTKNKVRIMIVLFEKSVYLKVQ